MNFVSYSLIFYLFCKEGVRLIKKRKIELKLNDLLVIILNLWKIFGTLESINSKWSDNKIPCEK